MTAFAFCCLTLLICSVCIIIYQRRRHREMYIKLGKLLDDAMEGNTGTIVYDETLLSAAEDKLLRYINTNKERLRNVQDDRNKIKTLISDISHQTKTPVSNILLYIDLLTENENLDEGMRQMTEDIRNQAEKLSFLVGALVKMSRLEAGIISIEAKNGLVKPVISSVVSVAYPRIAGKNINLTVSCEDKISACFDAKWTEEAIGNILDNAVKYSEPGNNISIEVIPGDMFIRIVIKDEGMGIDSEEINEIFKRFYRSPRVADREGVGVGLFLAREILFAQGGYIKASSEPDVGSVFSVFLPRESRQEYITG